MNNKKKLKKIKNNKFFQAVNVDKNNQLNDCYSNFELSCPDYTDYTNYKVKAIKAF